MVSRGLLTIVRSRDDHEMAMIMMTTTEARGDPSYRRPVGNWRLDGERLAVLLAAHMKATRFLLLPILIKFPLPSLLLPLPPPPPLLILICYPASPILVWFHARLETYSFVFLSIDFPSLLTLVTCQTIGVVLRDAPRDSLRDS